MRRPAALVCLLLLLLSGCGEAPPVPQPEETALSITDCTGRTLSLPEAPHTVVGLSSSMAEIWLLAGGALAGVTDDAVHQRDMDVGDAIVVGTIKKPVAESILALSPDLVIYSVDIESHRSMAELLGQSGVACYGAKVESFQDYLKVLADFTALTGRTGLYGQNGTAVAERIGQLKAQIPDGRAPTVLYLRAYSSGVDVQARDNVACDILADVGAVNVAGGNAALQKLSLEAIVDADPDFIFAVTMGDEAKAEEELDRALRENPAWDGLRAVQGGHFYLLPKELFHYKPNAKWGDAYAYLLEILWPEAFPPA